jgi:hypothetical protein
MERNNNRTGNYGNQDIKKLALSESERLMNKVRQQAKEAAKFSAIIGPTLSAAAAFDQRGQTVGAKIDINNNQVTINGNFEGEINTGDNATIKDIKIPKFKEYNNYIPDDDEEKDDELATPSFNHSSNSGYSNRSVIIGGDVYGSNIIMGDAKGDVIMNANFDSDTYSPKGNQIIHDNIDPLKKESIAEYIPEPTEDPWESNTPELPVTSKENALDELPVLNYEEIKNGPKQFNSVEEVFNDWISKKEIEFGIEPIPELAGDSSNMNEILEVINRNWETKYSNLLYKKANQVPPQKEVKEVVSKRDKIKNVLKSVGNRIKENMDKLSQKIDNYIFEDELDINDSPSFYVAKNIQTPEQKKLSDTIKQINNNQANYKYVTSEATSFGKPSPEMLQRRQKINEIKSKRTQNQNQDIPKKDFEPYLVPQSQIDNLNQLDNITIPDNQNQRQVVNNESISIESIENSSDQMDIKDQEKFIKDRMDSIDNLKTVEELENEIANIENGTISIPDMVAQESDYEDIEGTEHGVDKNGNISPVKLIKINEYQDARDINMLKTAEVLTALKQKKDLLKSGIDLENLSGPDKILYESRTFTLFNIEGQLVGMVGKYTEVPADKEEEHLPAIVDKNGRLVVTEPNGKQYVVTDIKSKIMTIKTEEIKKQLNSRIENL